MTTGVGKRGESNFQIGVGIGKLKEVVGIKKDLDWIEKA